MALALAAVLALWELLPRAGAVNPVLFPPLSRVIATFFELIAQGALAKATVVTLYRTVVALAAGFAAGVAFAALMVSLRPVRWLFEPFFSLTYPMPKIALIPIFVLWFGIGDLAKVLLATLTAFYPIMLSTQAAARGIRQSLHWSAQSLGAGHAAMIWKVVLPASIPGAMTGLQVAAPLTIIVVVVSEMTSSGGGLGNMLTVASRNFEMGVQFAVLFTLMLIGVGFDRLIVLVRKAVLRWE